MVRTDLQASLREQKPLKRSWADESERNVADEVADAWQWTMAFSPKSKEIAAVARPLRSSSNWIRQVTEDDDEVFEYDLVEKGTFLHAVARSRAPRMPRARSCPSMLSLADVQGVLEKPGMVDARRRPASWAACGSERVSETGSEGDHQPSCSSLDGSNSPKGSASEDGDDPVSWEGVCIVMMRNIPCRCDQKEVLQAIEDIGFSNLFAFCYLPVKRGHQQNSGFAFVGFSAPMLAIKFRDAMTGYSFPSRKSNKVVTVVPAHIQSLEQASALFKKTWAVGESWSEVQPEGPSQKAGQRRKGGQLEAGLQ